MLNKVKAYIEAHHLLHEDGKYIVGLSGGADSVALLLVLKHLGYNIEAAHCNFNLRGEESNRDEEYCKKLCKKLNIPFHLIHFDTILYAELHKVSIEMAARTLRYGYFENLRRDIQADAICIAHHRDDSVETILLNLIRGTGMRGLVGIRPKNSNIVRPMLDCSRHEIELFLKEKGVNFVTDSTNLIDDVKRNKLRLNVIPELRKMNPSFDNAVMCMANNVNEANKIIFSTLESAFSSIVTADITDPKAFFEALKLGLPTTDLPSLQIDIARLRAFVSPSYFLFYLLTPYGFAASMIESIVENLNLQSGKQYITNDYILLFNRNFILISRKKDKEMPTLRIQEVGKYIYSDQLSLCIQYEKVDENFVLSRQKNEIMLDVLKVNFPFTLRPLTAGDRFRPFGMTGSKLVSDYLTDEKVNVLDKKNQLVLTDSAGEIVWVVGRRSSEKGRVTAETNAVYRISLC